MTENNNILIVDDEPELREIIAFDFENAGFNVTCAENGRMALDLMTKEKFGAIISDIRMPVMDGAELLKRVREKNTNIVFIFISAYSDLTLESALNNGVDGIMIKPFDRRALVSSVQRLLLPATQRWITELKDIPSPQELSLSFSSLNNARMENKILVGRGGIFIGSTGKLPLVGSHIEFKIQFEEEKKIFEGVGVVRWVRPEGDKNKPAGIGVEFLKLNAPTMDDVLKELQRTNPIAFIPN